MTFPELKLPNLPRKFLMFVDESDIEERMVSFDCIMKIISRSKEMCISPPMLEFLGFSLTADKKYFKVNLFYLVVNICKYLTCRFYSSSFFCPYVVPWIMLTCNVLTHQVRVIDRSTLCLTESCCIEIKMLTYHNLG